MTRYLISFDDGAMTFPDEELPDVAKAAHEVVQEAQDAGVWVSGGGVKGHEVIVVATDGMITDGQYSKTKRHIGGFAIVDVPSREDALEWAAKIAVACRCAQEVRELGDDPTV
jgi:hypothetical protein